MYSKSMLLKTLGYLIVILFTFGTASANVLLSENWDTEDPPACWPCKTLPTCCTQTFNGWSGRTWACNESLGSSASGLSTTIYHSPPRSFFMKRPAGGSYACDLTKSFSPMTGKVYLRFYVYFTNSWLSFDYNNLQAGDSMIHFMFYNSALAGTSWRFEFYDYARSSPWPPLCFTSGVSQAYFSAANVGNAEVNSGIQPCFNILQNLNTWICMEFMLDLPGQKWAVWINGAQRVGTNGNGVSQAISVSDIHSLIISGFRSGGSPYIDNRTEEFYIDDIVIADQYIGLMAGDPTAPNAPLSLRILGN